MDYILFSPHATLSCISTLFIHDIFGLFGFLYVIFYISIV